MIKTWFESAPRLVDVAMGRTPADMVIRNVRWVNVHSGEIIPQTDIAISAGRFAFVGPDANHAIADTTQIIEGAGAKLRPVVTPDPYPDDVWQQRFAASTLGFARVHATPTRLEITFFDVDGRPLYDWEVMAP